MVEALKGRMVIQIATGWSHCMALTADGEAWVWGGNEYGQLGLGDKFDRFGPVKVQDSIKGMGAQIGFCVSIAGGHGHTLWLNASGLIYSAGRNDGGQLGVGDSIHRSHVSWVDIPVRVWCDTPFGSEVSGTFADWVCVGSQVRTACGKRCVGIPTRKDCGAKDAALGLQPTIARCSCPSTIWAWKFMQASTHPMLSAGTIICLLGDPIHLVRWASRPTFGAEWSVNRD